ncbi:MAG: 6-carboxytetrahydropterin synthase [Rhizobiaceae bacterium]
MAGIVLNREDLSFSAAHFVTSGGVLEELSGHSYQLSLAMTGDLDSEGILVDFRDIKPAIKSVIQKYNHKTLVPLQSPYITVRVKGDSTTVECGSMHFVLPTSHCVFVDAVNSSTEILSGTILNEFLSLLQDELIRRLDYVRLTISESPGQSAFAECSMR